MSDALERLQDAIRSDWLVEHCMNREEQEREFNTIAEHRLKAFRGGPGAVPGFATKVETARFFDKHAADIFAVLGADDWDNFRDTMAWRALEKVASDAATIVIKGSA